MFGILRADAPGHLTADVGLKKMHATIPKRLAPLASEFLQNQYMINGNAKEFLLPEEMLNDAYDCVRLAKGMVPASESLSQEERDALLELESYLDNIPLEGCRSLCELLETAEWQAARNCAQRIIITFGEDLYILEKEV